MKKHNQRKYKIKEDKRETIKCLKVLRLRAVAGGAGLAYHVLANDLEGVSFHLTKNKIL